jgi:hypothetical protein
MIKRRMARWKGHITRIGEKRNAYNILVEILEGKSMKGLRVGKRIILKLTLYSVGLSGLDSYLHGLKQVTWGFGHFDVEVTLHSDSPKRQTYTSEFL